MVAPALGLVTEAGVLTVAGALLGLALLYGGLVIAQPIVSSQFGLHIAITAPTGHDLTLLGIVVGAGTLAGAIPATIACRRSLADGMIVRT